MTYFDFSARRSSSSCFSRLLSRGAFLLACALFFGENISHAQSGAEQEAISLTTKDGLLLKASYYPPPTTNGAEKDAGKKVVPILMLHDFKRDRNAFAPLARYLQSKGHAVLVPDLRGHGESTKFVNPRRRKIEASRMGPREFAAIMDQDLPALRKFLVGKNDEGELNLNRVCIIGAEMGSALAIKWTARDWSWPTLPSVKQGRDVKALILLSPVWNFKGLDIRAAQEHPAIRSDRVAMFIMAGKQNGKSLRDAKRLYAALEPFHSKPPNKDEHQKKFLLRFLVPTRLQGTKMLEEMSKVGELKVEERIGDFIEWRTAEPNFEWSRRRNKS